MLAPLELALVSPVATLIFAPSSVQCAWQRAALTAVCCHVERGTHQVLHNCYERDSLGLLQRPGASDLPGDATDACREFGGVMSATCCTLRCLSLSCV